MGGPESDALVQSRLVWHQHKFDIKTQVNNRAEEPSFDATHEVTAETLPSVSY
jgi:hypothetical protein